MVNNMYIPSALCIRRPLLVPWKTFNFYLPRKEMTYAPGSPFTGNVPPMITNAGITFRGNQASIRIDFGDFPKNLDFLKAEVTLHFNPRPGHSFRASIGRFEITREANPARATVKATVPIERSLLYGCGLKTLQEMEISLLQQFYHTVTDIPLIFWNALFEKKAGGWR